MQNSRSLKEAFDFCSRAVEGTLLAFVVPGFVGLIGHGFKQQVYTKISGFVTSIVDFSLANLQCGVIRYQFSTAFHLEDYIIFSVRQEPSVY